MLANTSTCLRMCFVKHPDMAWVSIHIVVVITGFDLSQELLAIDVLTALKFS